MPVPLFDYSFRIELRIPDVDLATCDDGQYHLWVDPDGKVRTATPGEWIRLWVADVGGQLVVVDAGLSPNAPETVQVALDEAAEDSLALFYPAPAP